MENLNFMNYTTDYIAGVMSLRKPQEQSLKILEDILEKTNLIENHDAENALKQIHESYPICSSFERSFISLTFALATGVGKTRLMGAFISFLYTHYGIKDFLVIAPNTTIYDKLRKDLGYPDSSKYVFKGLGCFSNPPKVIADDDYANRNISLFASEITIYVYNIGKFDKEKTKMKAFNENLGMSFYKKLSSMENLVVIMDESHHYRADKGMETINNLNPVLGLELTATPIVNKKGKQVPFENVVYEYPLSSAIRDGYTRVPFAATRSDINFYNFGDSELDKLMLNDGIICHKRIKEKLQYYSRANKEPLVKPFMLVVCKDTNHAAVIEQYIKSDEFEYGHYKHKTITINSKQSNTESDINTRLLLDVENVDNPVEIVIHVNMLKEGWDVNNLYTIVPLRTASSKVLREQMVGRGLRLPYGQRTGDKAIDSVVLTAHDKFQEIIEEAQKGDSIFNKGNIIKVEDIEHEKMKISQIALDLGFDNFLNDVPLKCDEDVKRDFSKIVNTCIHKNVENWISYHETESMTYNDRNVVCQKIENEVKENKDFGEVYKENKEPLKHWLDEKIGKYYDQLMAKFILIPKIKTQYKDGEYFFEDFDLDLSKFKQEPIHNEIVIQNLLDMSDERKISSDPIVFEVNDPVKAIMKLLRNKPEIDYEKNATLLFKLANQLVCFWETNYDVAAIKNIVMMFKKEIVNEIYSQMSKHFVRNEGFFREVVFPDPPINYAPSYTYTVQKKIFDPFNSKKNGNITSVLFDNINRGVFSTAKFDSEAELILARILEKEDNFVDRWLRPSSKQFDITYNNGKRYEPDFVVDTNEITYLVEVKADNQLEDKDVIAKKEAGILYCNIVSKWATETANKIWIYVLIPASVIKPNSTFYHLAQQYKCLEEVR